MKHKQHKLYNTKTNKKHKKLQYTNKYKKTQKTTKQHINKHHTNHSQQTQVRPSQQTNDGKISSGGGIAFDVVKPALVRAFILAVYVCDCEKTAAGGLVGSDDVFVAVAQHLILSHPRHCGWWCGPVVAHKGSAFTSLAFQEGL